MWAMHQMSDIGNIFIQNLMRGKYTFSKVLFSQSIEEAFKEEQDLMKHNSQKYNAKNFTNQEINETFFYMVPLIKEGSNYEINC